MEMSLTQLNELLKRALNELGDEGATIVTFYDPTKPLLPESYWTEQHASAQRRRDDALAQEVGDLFERSIDIAQERIRRKAEDERLANMSVDELLDDVPTLWEGEPTSRWGKLPMSVSGGVRHAPTKGAQSPSYPWQCYQCSRPITAQGKDHAGRYRCDHATLDPSESGHHDHQPKPWHGEEEDE